MAAASVVRAVSFARRIGVSATSQNLAEEFVQFRQLFV
jgi:hypothetical protein